MKKILVSLFTIFMMALFMAGPAWAGPSEGKGKSKEMNRSNRQSEEGATRGLDRANEVRSEKSQGKAFDPDREKIPDLDDLDEEMESGKEKLKKEKEKIKDKSKKLKDKDLDDDEFEGDDSEDKAKEMTGEANEEMDAGREKLKKEKEKIKDKSKKLKDKDLDEVELEGDVIEDKAKEVTREPKMKKDKIMEKKTEKAQKRWWWPFGGE